MKKRNNASTGGDRVFMLLVYLMAAVAFVVTLYPFLYVIAVSLSGSQAIYRGEVFLIPKEVTLDGYRQVMSQKGLWVA